MYEIDEFGCLVLPKQDLDLDTTAWPSSAQKKYRTNCVMRKKRDTSISRHMCDGIRVSSGILGCRVRGHHEAFLYTLSQLANPFFEIFNRYDILDCLRGTKRIRNEWRHGWLQVLDTRSNWGAMVWELNLVNDALKDAFAISYEIQAEGRSKERQYGECELAWEET
ncbi:hypothetical protein JMJ35_005245 [Cladonia borealis]|uniref:Uncharacterized protein n=1 Tax=Cladonia borealis TaxID=184061 RepID=A0AA39QZG9_9LECA|nr:hypothetical protein JMJ35_005245 [Cladonia borealis]